MDKQIEEKINTLSIMEQNSQHMAAQRQSLQTQLLEMDSALEELGSSTESYKIIGNIMVKADSKSLKEDLSSKKELISVKIASIEKQESASQEKTKKLQQEIMRELESANKEKVD